jgi:hypothetical protein
MKFGGGEFSTGTMGNFQPELTPSPAYLLGVFWAHLLYLRLRSKQNRM